MKSSALALSVAASVPTVMSFLVVSPSSTLRPDFFRISMPILIPTWSGLLDGDITATFEFFFSFGGLWTFKSKSPLRPDWRTGIKDPRVRDRPRQPIFGGWGIGRRSREELMDNSEVAAVLYEIADLLELQGIAFKPQAYRRAARNIEQLDIPLSQVVADGKLDDIPGVGEALSKKIQELLSTGELSYLDKLRSETPEGLVRMLDVP